MNRRVGSMNLWLDRALMRHDMSHINVTGASSFVREDFMRHGIHLNSQGKKKLMQLAAVGFVDVRVSSTSTKRLPSFSLNSKAHRYLACSL
jgi:hypothetical protein